MKFAKKFKQFEREFNHIMLLLDMILGYVEIITEIPREQMFERIKKQYEEQQNETKK